MITYLTMAPNQMYVQSTPDGKIVLPQRIFIKEEDGTLHVTKLPCKNRADYIDTEFLQLTMIDLTLTFEPLVFPKELAVEKILCYSTASGALNWRRESSPPTPEEGLKRLKKFDFNTSELE